MNESLAEAAPGWFGKLPMLGDFASRRLSASFIAVCDDWLARGIAQSRAQLGEAWLETYLRAPLWRYAWAPGIVDQAWWFGVLMPSVDSAGRYFPLLVACASAGAPTSEALDAAYARMTRAALDNLRPQATVEGFEAALASVVLDPAPATTTAEQFLPGRHRLVASAIETPGEWTRALATLQFAGMSLWSPDLSGARERSLSIATGLPPPEQFGELLAGRW